MTTAEYHNDLPSPFQRAAVHHYDGEAANEVTHSHDSYQFTYILEGAADFLVSGVRRQLAAGQLALLRPGVTHHFHTAANVVTRAYNCYGGIPSREQLGRIADFLAPWLRNQFLVATPPPQDFQPLVKRLLDSRHEPEATRYATEYTLNLQLLIACCRAMLAEHPFPLVPDIPAQVVKSLHYIEKSFHQPLTLARLAAVSALSPSRFSSLFADALGCPPMHYVHRRRLSRAKDLLIFSEHDVTQVARQTGFASASYFCRVFKAATGCSPAAFRHAHAVIT